MERIKGEEALLKFKCSNCGREWGMAWRISDRQYSKRCKFCEDNRKGVRYYEATLGTIVVRLTARNMEQARKKAEMKLCRFRRLDSLREEISIEHIRRRIAHG